MTNVISIRGLSNFLGGKWIHKDLDLDIPKGQITAIVGGSGSGKTTLLRSILMLLTPVAGDIDVFGVDIINCPAKKAREVQHRWGMTFQRGALFSSLTVAENIKFPMLEFTDITSDIADQMVNLKLTLSGLPVDTGIKYPSELSGGMLKRAAVARAIALDPELLFLDEPTAGLDPQAAAAIDELVLQLRRTLGLTVVLVTHDLDTLWTVPDEVAFLGEGRVLALGTTEELSHNPHPLIQDYFSGPRAKPRAK